MVCSKQTKPTASQVAIIATYMQPVTLCRIILYKSILDQYFSNS